MLIRATEKNQAREGNDRAEAQMGALGLFLVATGVFQVCSSVIIAAATISAIG